MKINVISIFRPLLVFLVAVYFVVDAVFIGIARPISNWLANRTILNDIRVWIVSLRPYPTLALFIVPFILLEPVKPIAVYLIGTGSVLLGAAVLVIGEILKLVLVERLFDMSRDKLLSIPIIAWGYGRWRFAVDLLHATEIFQYARGVVLRTRSIFRNALRVLASEGIIRGREDG